MTDEVQLDAASRYEVQAAAWDRPALLSVWEQIKQGEKIDGWDSGKAFEYLVVRAFQLEDAEVVWPYNVTYPQRFGTMEQIDGLVRVDGVTFLIESKDRTEPLSIEAIAKLRFRLEGRPPGTMSVLFSKSNFTPPTEIFAQFASPLNVLLWGVDDLDYALPNSGMVSGLRVKYRVASKLGVPLYPIKEV